MILDTIQHPRSARAKLLATSLAFAVPRLALAQVGSSTTAEALVVPALLDPEKEASAGDIDPSSRPVSESEAPRNEPPGLAAPPAATSTSAEVMRVVGRLRDSDRVAGSAYSVDEATLDRFDYDDVGRTLVKVPGVYIRDEDGFGLRPNIGIRGAEADRSSKVALLEDGILLGPAPYSAPAAYFVPLATRMVGLEVAKGPASIRYGPNTVGGAINYLTAPIPSFGSSGLIDVSAGQFGYMKGHGRVGYGTEHWGLLLEGVRVQSSGFKELDGGGDTGFEKNEVMVKGRLSTERGDPTFHELAIKLGWADEVSNETYLGLSVPDFRANPYRRYRASALDQMVWERTQIELSYRFEWDDVLVAQLVGYRHDFSRQWFRLNSVGSPAVIPSEFLGASSGPDFEVFQVLRGQATSTARSQLMIGNNDRRFVSQGAQLDGYFDGYIGDLVEHRLKFGLRLHHDRVQRNHTENTYSMIHNAGDLDFGNLVREEIPTQTNLVNDEDTLAFSGYLQEDITFFEWLTLSPGLRIESIFSSSEQTVPTVQPRTEDDYTVLIPGVGVYAQVLPELGVFGGVHRGFSPKAPGQDTDVDIESSTNYEVGTRFRHQSTSAELIGFLSDYENLLFTCTFGQSCPNADVGQQENLGSVLVYGLEASASQRLMLGSKASLEASASYTWTFARLGDDFESDEVTSPRYRNGLPGDPLPDRPEHQASVSLLGRFPLGRFWGEVGGSYIFVDRMLDEAIDPDAPDALFTDVQHLVDAHARLELDNGGRFYVNVTNLFDEAYIASYRPFGARPGAPRIIRFGYAHQF